MKTPSIPLDCGLADEQKPNDMSLIGCSVKKVSGKPFKSGLKTNTIKGFMRHPQINRKAFTFFEDDSYVACYMCFVFKEKKQ